MPQFRHCPPHSDSGTELQAKFFINTEQDLCAHCARAWNSQQGVPCTSQFQRIISRDIELIITSLRVGARPGLSSRFFGLGSTGARGGAGARTSTCNGSFSGIGPTV
mmetsp:Transcript_149319/g.362667  ORF Transcript_149319/g.362667 Transcript_149319/m.362667 type:complete len:107 (-) Transcript_149319:208-528(-)